jgi:transposase
MHIASIGIDLGKTDFHLVALGERSKVVVRKKLSPTQLLAYMANQPPAFIGLEASSGAHVLGGTLREQGHEVRLIPAQFVKPYRKSKDDFPMQKRSLKRELARSIKDVFGSRVIRQPSREDRYRRF